MALTPESRSEIVSLTSNHRKFNAPLTGNARLLTLSALGSSLDLRFDFPKVSDFNVTHWSNRATLDGTTTSKSSRAATCSRSATKRR